MIKGINIICFSDDWGKQPSSCQHIIGRLTENNKVLWVDTIGMRNPRMNPYDFFRIGEKILSWLKPIKKVQKNLYVYSPPMLPYNNIETIRLLNKIIMIKSIKWILKRLKMERPVLWTSVPNVVDVIGKLGEVRSVFYCYDEFSKWPGVSHNIVKKMEDDLVEKVDLILATSTRLCQEKKSSHCPTYLLSHGVDVNHFAMAMQKDLPCPTELLNITRPIIGTYGSFDEKFDFDLLEFLALNLPQYSFVLVGIVLVDITRLKQIKNIHFLPPVSYEDLPAYAQSFDVCVLLYLVEDLLTYSNPLKLREFLAAGRPVVSTALPEVEKYKDVVRIAYTKEDFVQQIELSLKEDTTQFREKRQKAVINESWENRTKEASLYLERLLIDVKE